MSDTAGNVLYSDLSCDVIRSTRPDGSVVRIVGTDARGFSGDNIRAVNASPHVPREIAFDPDGNLYIADRQSWRY